MKNKLIIQIIALHTIFLCANRISSQSFLACHDNVTIHATSDPLIFNEDWLIDGFNGNIEDLILSVYDQSILIGDFQFGVSEWADAILYDGKTLDYIVTNTITNNSCPGSFNLSVNQNSQCIVIARNNIFYSFPSTQDFNFGIGDFVQTACDKDYSITFINANGTFGPFISKIDEEFTIVDGSSMICNESPTRIEFFAVDNVLEFYFFEASFERTILNINWNDIITTTKTYEGGIITSTSKISGGGNRTYNAWFPFGQPEFSMIELQTGFETELGTTFTAQISRCE